MLGSSFDVSTLLNDSTWNVDVLSSYLPCMIHVHRLPDLHWTYIDPRSQKWLNVEDEGIRVVTFEAVAHPGDLQRALKLCHHYIESLDRYSLLSFILRLQPIGTSQYHNVYTTFKYVEELDGLLGFSLPLDYVNLTEGSIQTVLEESNFGFNHIHLFSKLTQREQVFIQHWTQGLKNQVIAEKMSITQESVKSYKKRIYKKLNIHNFVELHQYACTFELIQNTHAHFEKTGCITQRINHSSEQIGHWHFEFSKPQYPGFIHVHHIHDLSVCYLDRIGYQELGLTSQNVEVLGPNFFRAVHHPDDHQRCIEIIQSFIETRHTHDICTLFQRIRVATQKGEAFRIILTSMHIREEKLICISNTTDQMPLLNQKIWNALCPRPDEQQIAQRFQLLSRRERELIPLLVQGKSVKELAPLLHISTRTVEQHKKNIYKKMKISSLQELINLVRLLGQHTSIQE